METGVDLANAIDRLVPPGDGKGRLPPAPARDAIGESVSEALPIATSPTGDGSGPVSPWVEQAYTGSTYYSIVSSDGLFIWEYPDQTIYIDDDGNGDAFTVKHLDQTP